MLSFSRRFTKKTGILLGLALALLFGVPTALWANDGKVPYHVKKGDTLTAIAKANYTDGALVAAMNNLQENQGLQVGQLIYLPKDPELEVMIAQGDTIWTLAKRYQTNTTDLINYNNLTEPENLKLGQKLLVPVVNLAEEPQAIAVSTIASRGERLQRLAIAKANEASAKRSVASQAVTTAKIGSWDSPLTGIVTSAFGKRHNGYHHGLDVAAAKGTKIKAIADGTVTFAGWKNAVYGYAVEVDHGNGWKSLYAHASKVLVKTGYKIKAGKNIALVGSTGNSTGPHLHLELRKDGTLLNPAKYVQVD